MNTLAICLEASWTCSRKGHAKYITVILSVEMNRNTEFRVESSWKFQSGVTQEPSQSYNSTGKELHKSANGFLWNLPNMKTWIHQMKLHEVQKIEWRRNCELNDTQSSFRNGNHLIFHQKVFVDYFQAFNKDPRRILLQ